MCRKAVNDPIIHKLFSFVLSGFTGGKEPVETKQTKNKDLVGHCLRKVIDILLVVNSCESSNF